MILNVHFIVTINYRDHKKQAKNENLNLLASFLFRSPTAKQADKFRFFKFLELKDSQHNTKEHKGKDKGLVFSRLSKKVVSRSCLMIQ